MNLRTIDHKLTCLLHNQAGKRPWLDKLAVFVARDLPWIFLLFPVAVVLVTEFHRGNSKKVVVAFFLVIMGVAWFITQLIAYGLQFLFARKRPFQSEELHPMYHARIPSPSFPSGHATMVSFVLTGVGLLVYGSVPLTGEGIAVFWTVAGMGSAILVARVYGGLHYVSDILAGLLLGSGMFFVFLKLIDVYFKVFVYPNMVL